MRTSTCVIAVTATLIMSSQASAVLTLTSGSATFTDLAPATPTTTNFGGNGTAGFDNFAAGDGVINQMFESGWAWRINGVDNREFAFSQQGMVEAGSGTSLGTRTYANVNNAFSAVMNYALADTGTGQALVTQTLVVTNTSAAPLNMSLFHYADFDILNTFGGDTGTWFDQSNNIMNIQDGGTFGRYQGVGANAWQVTAFATLRTALTDGGTTNLNNTGLPFGPGDFTGGFQWNSTIAAGGSATFVAILGINTNVPSPGGLALLGVAGLVGRRRRG